MGRTASKPSQLEASAHTGPAELCPRPPPTPARARRPSIDTEQRAAEVAEAQARAELRGGGGVSALHIKAMAIRLRHRVQSTPRRASEVADQAGLPDPQKWERSLKMCDARGPGGRRCMSHGDVAGRARRLGGTPYCGLIRGRLGL